MMKEAQKKLVFEHKNTLEALGASFQCREIVGWQKTSAPMFSHAVLQAANAEAVVWVHTAASRSAFTWTRLPGPPSAVAVASRAWLPACLRRAARISNAVWREPANPLVPLSVRL